MISHGWRYYCCAVMLAVVPPGCRSGVPDNLARTASSTAESHAARDSAALLPPIWAPASPLATTSPAAGEAPTAGEACPSEGLRQAAAYQQPEDELPIPSALGQAVGQEELLSSATTVQLRDVILSVQAAYPLLIHAELERAVASGNQLATRGEFDLRAKAFGVAAPEGYYQTYRNGASLEQPLFHGGYVYGGYKIGDGDFQPWFKERETDEGGEFSIGFGTPLLKDRAIDKRRAEMFQADLARQAVQPAVRAQLLEFVRVATRSYWTWVAAGQVLIAQRELLQNARDRVAQIQTRVEAGDLARIARINNQQLIAARETKVIEATRKLQQAAIKLSLFYRNAAGEPVIPDDAQLPAAFPRQVAPDRDSLAADIALAIEASPELAELEFVAEQVRVELRKAENMLLPKLDAVALASKDVGAPASSKRDKTPFELEAGLFGELPLQRRGARGKIGATQGKLAQINAKRQYVLDKTVAAVQDARSAFEAAAAGIQRATTNLRLARETLQLGRLQFDSGDIDLVELNIYEKSVTDAQLLLISAEADYFGAIADYRAALALDPLATDPVAGR